MVRCQCQNETEKQKSRPVRKKEEGRWDEGAVLDFKGRKLEGEEQGEEDGGMRQWATAGGYVYI